MATPDLTELIAQRRHRRTNIAAAQVLLDRHQLYAIADLLYENRVAAGTEAERFEERIGEALPPHAAYALETEMSMLERLTEGIAVFAQSEPTPRDYEQYVGHAADFLQAHTDLLDLEVRLLGTCLTQYFYDRIDAIRADADRIPL